MIIKNGQRLVFLGDSLTQRTSVINPSDPAISYALDYVGSYVDILLKHLLINCPELQIDYLNKGIAGNTTQSLLDRIEKDVIAFKPDWVFLFVGQNDAGKSVPIEEFKKNLEVILNTLKQNGIAVVQMSTTPYPDDAERSAVLDVLDDIIKASSKAHVNVFVDLKKPFKRVLAANRIRKNPVNLFNDGCHLSKLGNMLIADQVYAALLRN
ncbi:MAG: hypothetical protein KAS17_10815 [Victivallaceae bacterium]|nr:hypothetical protein [Victivallaceae bacterium]